MVPRNGKNTKCQVSFCVYRRSYQVFTTYGPPQQFCSVRRQSLEGPNSSGNNEHNF